MRLDIIPPPPSPQRKILYESLPGYYVLDDHSDGVKMETSYAQGTNSAEERDSCEERHLTKSPSQANIAAHDQEEDNSDNSHLIMDANHVCVTPSGAAPESGGSNLPECQNEEISTQASDAGHRDTLLDVADDEDISMATSNDSLNDIFVQISSLRSAMNSVVAGLDELEKSCRTIYQNLLKSSSTQQHVSSQGSRAEPLITAQNRETYTRSEHSTAAQNGEGDTISSATYGNEDIRENVTMEQDNINTYTGATSLTSQLGNREQTHTGATSLTEELSNREEIHTGATPLTAEIGYGEEMQTGATSLAEELGNREEIHTGATPMIVDLGNRAIHNETRLTATSSGSGNQMIADTGHPGLTPPQGNSEA